MARSPFSGTYQPNIRPTIVTAPDAVVFFNGESDIIACPSCRRRVPFNKYITSIQVDLNVDSAPGSASISMSIPRHAVDEMYFDGQPILTPMLEVEIFAKGYYLVEGIPQYYPIFWGLVTEVGENYSSGEHTLSIQCADILKWWELCRMSINSAFTAPGGQMGKSLFGNVLFGKNPYDLIYTLAHQSFGDVVIGTGSLNTVVQENNQSSTFKAALADAMLYWEERFSRIRSNLLLYGVNGVAVRGASLDEAYRTNKTFAYPLASTAVMNANGKLGETQMVFDPTDPAVTAFRTQFNQVAEINLWQSEFETKLNIANSCKTAIGFEFYMDVTGDIVFKPPFYNLDIIENKPVSWIQDIDIISYDFSESEAEVVTQLQIDGSWAGNVDYGMPEELTPHVTVTDYHLLRKYGWRVEPLNSEFLGSPIAMFYYGMDMLDRLNSRRHRGSVTIPCRPELRLGFPVYIACKDQIWYVSGISHSIEFGGRAQTTLTLTAKRGKFIAPVGIGSIDIGTRAPGVGPKDKGPKQLAKHTWKLKIGDAASLPPTKDQSIATDSSPYSPLILRHPKTGRLCGYPNVVMVYTRPFAPSPEQVMSASGRNPKGQASQVPKQKRQAYQKMQEAQGKEANKGLVTDDIDKLRAKYAQNRFQYGLTSMGVYVYAHDKSKLLNQFVLIPSSQIQTEPKEASVGGKLQGLIRPVSDDRGFEVIGHFRYGRGVKLRDGSLVMTPGKTNQKANVDFQAALSGDLLASLLAQSQGLSAITSNYPNPARYLATLAPEDSQTAAIIEPKEGPKFVNADTSFVQSAPLESPERKGIASSVEASQLSRALTLAELTVLDDTPKQEDCVCMTGRPDLTFMNVGYQVVSIRGTTLDSSALFAPEKGELTNPPVKPAQVKMDQLQSRVETFLFDLYQKLDRTHQEYEKGLRGDLVTNAQEEFSLTNATSRTNQTPGSGFEPPFSQPNRAALGDQNAVNAQVDAAKSDLKQTWQEASDKLKSKAKKAELSQKVSNDQRELALLYQRKQALERELAKGPDAGKEQELAEVNAEIAKMQQQLANDQLELARVTQAAKG